MPMQTARKFIGGKAPRKQLALMSPVTGTRVKKPTKTGKEGCIRKSMKEAPTLESRAVTVLVGEGRGQKSFQPHQDLLTSHSKFFHAALNGRSWKEAQAGVVELKDVEIETFRIFQQFLYTGSIYSANDNDLVELFDAGIIIDHEYERIANCWALGDKLMSISFKDAITDALISKLSGDTFSPTELLDTLWPLTQPSSGIRRLLDHAAMWLWDHKELGDWVTKGSRQPEFFFEMAKELYAWKTYGIGESNEAPFHSEDTCDYHEHDVEDKPCYKTMF